MRVLEWPFWVTVECVDLSSSATRYGSLVDAIAACGDRLVDAAVKPAEARSRLSKIAGSVVAVGFVLGLAQSLVLPVIYGPFVLLAALFITLAAASLVASSVASAPAAHMVVPVGMVVAVAIVAALAAMSGGGASPVAILLAGIAAEAWWAQRSRKSIIAGVLAIAGGALAIAVFSKAGNLPQFTPSMWLWLPALAHAALFAMRLLQPERAVAPTPSLDIADMLSAAVVSFNAKGEVSDVAGNSADHLGIAPALLIGSGLFNRVHVTDRVAFMQAIGEARQSAGRASCEVRLRLPAGQDETRVEYRLFQFDMAGAAEGRVEAILRRARDVEALRDDLARAEADGEQVAIARNRLLASVSHELRTPLNAIIGFSDMLLLELHGRLANDRQREQVGLVRDAGHHLLGVVNSILDVSKLESGAHMIRPEKFEFVEAVDLSRSMVSTAAAAKGISIETNCSPEVTTINADRRAVQQILINLLSNAVKFTPDGGVVTIDARQGGEFLVLSVSDTGIGIAASDIDRLGEPFTQIHNDYTRKYDGVGLGLSLVKGLVALHGGTMRLESALGRGTTVTLALPLEGPSALAKAHRPAAANITTLNRRVDRGTDDGVQRKTA